MYNSMKKLIAKRYYKSAGEAQDKIDVFFRVRQVFGKSEVVVSAGDEVIQVFKRPFMAPGEMQHIVIPADKLKGFDTITVSAKEA